MELTLFHGPARLVQVEPVRLPSTVLAKMFRGIFLGRRAAARVRALIGPSERLEAWRRESEEDLRSGRQRREDDDVTGREPRRRNILFITTDQQRFDALGVNGGKVARTPVIDAVARGGLSFHRAHVQNVVCMPSRSTMLTGQHPLTHGVVANGVALPDDAPSVARHLRREAGYRTALIGKAHFEPHLDPLLAWFENRCAAEGWTGPWRGFEHVELATHGPMGGHHYAAWLWQRRPDLVGGFGGVLTGAGGGETGAPEVKHNPIPREFYHTDWIASRTVAWLRSLPADEPWFCWMSFPDPHHPFDPPLEEVEKRPGHRDVPLPDGHPGSPDAAREILRRRPRHWLDWYEGRFRNPEGGPVSFVPSRLEERQIREINAMIHVENELIDEACGSVLEFLAKAGRLDDTDVFFTSDHGELQGDYGLVFKGPYHVDSLLRVPLVWKPAACARVDPAVIPEPVGHVDLAPTFCAVAGVSTPDWMQGSALPTAPGGDRDAVITTFDSQFAPVGMHLRTLWKDGLLCTEYLPSTTRIGGDWPLYWALWSAGTRVPKYDGTEGELYDGNEDPLQRDNLWDDPARRRRREELREELRDRMPPARPDPLPFGAPT